MTFFDLCIAIVVALTILIIHDRTCAAIQNIKEAKWKAYENIEIERSKYHGDSSKTSAKEQL